MKVLSLFSGIGAFEKALQNIGEEIEIIGYSEVDKYASRAYSAIHNISEDKNLGDIKKIDQTKLENVDLITYGFPCQDISVAGKQKGINKDTRSGLLYDALRIIRYKKPKYAIAENVKNLVGKRFKKDFYKLLEELEEMGYNNYWKVLNAKDYGIPQNRERVFIVSIRKDLDKRFEFPKPFNNGLRLRDMLDDGVEGKYYIKQEKTESLIKQLKDKNQEISYCIDANYHKGVSPEQFLKKSRRQLVAVKEATKKGYDIATDEDSINVSFPDSKTRRGRVGKGVAQTLETSCTQAILENDYNIRKLTPLECWRLMGFSDKDYWIARKELEKTFYKSKDRSNSQMYKMAGNSIVVNVLEEIFKNLI